jgi:lysophospholipase L1-like esterase
MNPLGSSAPQDLYDNAENFDHLSNDLQNEKWKDRFGRDRKTWYGIEKQSDQAMLNYGYITKKSFEVGATLDTPNTVLQLESDGEFYRWDGDWSQPKVVPPGSTPDTTGGIGPGKWVGVSDASLRGDLAKVSGSDIINTPNGDSVQDTILEAKTTEYDAASYFGGQLAAFKNDMADPLTQQVNLTLVGDSITWGLYASGIASQTPRNHTLSDARNNGSSDTWANLFHKWVSKEWFNGIAAVESATTGVPSGVNVFTYSKLLDLFPGQQGIALLGSWVQSASSSALKGVYIDAQYPFTGKEINFSITGDAFFLVFAAIPNGSTYQVLVDNVSIGTFTTNSTDMGVPVGFGNSREHSLGPFTGARSIRIVPNGATGTTLRVEGIRIKKQFQCINQGIIGILTAEYKDNLLNDAVIGRSRHVFVQLGTNDRNGTYSSIGAANTVMRLKSALEDLVTALGTRYVTLLCANNVTEDESGKSFTMSDVRDVVYSTAYKMGLDFIDNFSPINTLIRNNYEPVADTIHPNDFGHATLAGNIIKAVSNATRQKLSIKEATTSLTATIPTGWSAINTVNFNFPTTPKSVLGYSVRVKLSTETDFGNWSSSQEVVTDDSGTAGGVQNPSGVVQFGMVRTFLSAGGATRAIVKSTATGSVTINVEARAYWI